MRRYRSGRNVKISVLRVVGWVSVSVVGRGASEVGDGTFAMLRLGVEAAVLIVIWGGEGPGIAAVVCDGNGYFSVS